MRRSQNVTKVRMKERVSVLEMVGAEKSKSGMRPSACLIAELGAAGSSACKRATAPSGIPLRKYFQVEILFLWTYFFV